MIQIQSVEAPFKEPELVGATFGVLRGAGAMGLYNKAIPKLDFAAFREVVRSVSRAGIGREAELLTATRSPKDFDSVELLRSIERLRDALEESPAPKFGVAAPRRALRARTGGARGSPRYLAVQHEALLLGGARDA